MGIAYERKEIERLYGDVIREYEGEIKLQSYEVKVINNTERVYVFENGKLVIYLGLINYDSRFDDDGREEMHVVFEEFMKNTIFKFSFAAFKRKFNTSDGLQMIYKKFHGWMDPLREINDITLGNFQRLHPGYTADRYLIESKGQYVDEHFPELRLRAMYEAVYDAWDGDNYIFNVYEVIYGDRVGHAVSYEKDFTGTKDAEEQKKREEDWADNILITTYDGIFAHFFPESGSFADSRYIHEEKEYRALSENGIVPNMITRIHPDIEAIDIMIDSMWSISPKKSPAEEIIITFRKLRQEKKFKEVEEAHDYTQKLYQLARQNVFANSYTEKCSFDGSTNKAIFMIKYYLDKHMLEWGTSEYSISPDFLVDSKNRYYYDFYIESKKIAVIYRPKDYFEVTEAENGLERLRDIQQTYAVIEDISKRNKVDIIYIDYTDNIYGSLLEIKYAEIECKRRSIE